MVYFVEIEKNPKINMEPQKFSKNQNNLEEEQS